MYPITCAGNRNPPDSYALMIDIQLAPYKI